MKCKNCEYQKEDVESRLGHEWTDDCDNLCDRDECGYIRTPPHKWSSDCDDCCDLCFYFRTPTGNHQYVFDYYSPVHPHQAWEICTQCDKKRLTDEEDYWDSYWGSWFVIYPPTCTQNGIEMRELLCTKCNAWLGEEERIVPALGHNYVFD